MKKDLMITDSDLDGLGCSIVFTYANIGNPLSEIDVLYSSPFDVEKEVKEIIEAGTYDDYENILITDLSISYELAQKIKDLGITNIRIFDHHASALALNDFDFCTIKVTNDYDDRLRSACRLLFDKIGPMYSNSRLDIVSMLVSEYDTFRWKKTGDNKPKMLNDLFYLYGRDRLRNHLIKFIDNKGELFGETEEFLLKLEKEKEDKYIERMSEDINTIMVGDYNIAVFYNVQYISNFLSHVCENNRDVDIAATIDLNRNSISMRTISDEIDLSAIAKAHGGGGHPKAAGFPFKADKVKEDLYKAIFTKI